GRTGIARLAMESGAPVIPVAVADTDKVQPSGKLLPSIHRVSLSFGEPMYFTGDANDLQVLRDVTDEIMHKIQEMSGQEYVDTYASTVKGQEPRD
ncbi:MAG: hypothetical protein RLZ57_911, partial [Actinomycetota bacterium]